MYQIVKAIPHADYTVTLTWSDRQTSQADFRHILNGPVMVPLRDAAFFTKNCRVSDDGRVLAWSDELEFCADALRYKGFPEDYRRDYPGSAAAE